MIDENVIARLKASLSDDGTVIRQLVDLYANDAPQQLADAAAALEKPEMTMVARAAHSLKSTSASMGATTVTGIALELEQQARKGDAAACAATLERLRQLSRLKV
jgi:HPt (histidine-containing phosphotransfer) domain-containing protein